MSSIIFEVRVNNECVYVGTENNCDKLANILYEYYKEDNPAPSILKINQNNPNYHSSVVGSEQDFIEQVLDDSNECVYEDGY